MKKLKIKSNTYHVLMLKVYQKITDGWKMVKYPVQRFWGAWFCKMEKKNER